MKANYQIPSRLICLYRAWLVCHLRTVGGCNLREIARILRMTPEEVRRYEAKARRLWP